VYDEFIICQDKVIDAIVNWLEDVLYKGIVHFKRLCKVNKKFILKSEL